ncbi:MAG: hypothetical protein DMF85_01045 [Acidobacteria bacterium]|nr:MAG: hypothetical protein DMF85_01045 [Acidobacteriota bacterium]
MTAAPARASILLRARQIETRGGVGGMCRNPHAELCLGRLILRGTRRRRFRIARRRLRRSCGGQEKKEKDRA